MRKVAPEWLARERVLGSLGLGPEQGRGYEAYMEARVLELGIKAGRKELQANWRSLRRGWYVGSEKFREGLLARAKAALQGKRCESHADLQGRLHNQSRAEEMLTAGLRLLKLGLADLEALPKGQLEKQVLAWWLVRADDCEAAVVGREAVDGL